MSNVNLKKTYVYVYELPYSERKELCDIIDMNEKWEELGGKYMQFDCATLFRISKAPMRNHSPTNELLTLWGVQNHTILELFIILHKMQHYRSMTILKPFVDQKYHKLIYQGDRNFSDLVKSETGNNSQNGTCNLITFDSNSNKRRDNQDSLEKKKEQTYSDSSVTFSSAEACTPLITYNELEQATNYWNKSNILGKGGFGVVFKGIWKNTAVAIKRLESQKRSEPEFDVLEAQRQQSLKELKYLNSCRHDNILSLYGFSIGGEKPCLVYQYMINGSLEDRLQCRQGTKPLTWYIRFKIATGSARGLQFLHGMDKPLVHGDIKSANILLDPYFEPRIGDFGLAREGPLQEFTHVKVSHVHGTRPYLPDEFLRGNKFSTKVDTYSFGVVLFEIATGQRAYDSLRHHKFLKDHIENYDCPITDVADLKAGTDEHNVFSSLISIGKVCVSNKAKDRPEMEQVLRQLEQLDCAMLQEKQQSTIRNSCMPTFQYEMQVRKQSTPSASYHPQPWLFSHVPSNQLLKPSTSLAPHFGVVTVPDQIQEAVIPPSSSRFTDVLSSDNKSSFSGSLMTSDCHKDFTCKSTPHFVESEIQTSIEKKNNVWKNSIPGECTELPLISKLQVQPNENNQEQI